MKILRLAAVSDKQRAADCWPPLVSFLCVVLDKVIEQQSLYETKHTVFATRMATTKTTMATAPDASWSSNPAAAAQSSGNALLNFVTGGGTGNAAAKTEPRPDPHAWTKGGRQFQSHREIYTRSLYRLCLKFTTSEDEDEGKPEPCTAFWTLYGRPTSIGNGGPSSATPDNICRRMDDSMSGPAAGVLTRITDADGDDAAQTALRSAFTIGWQLKGDRGDAAIRVGKAKVFSTNKPGSEGAGRDAQILSLDADRWVLCKGASFAAGNSVFTVEDFNESKQKLTVHSSKGPLRGKLIDIYASRCPFVFGRAHEADLCIMDRELSRRHGAILYVNRDAKNRGIGKGSSGFFILVDLESTVSFGFE